MAIIATPVDVSAPFGGAGGASINPVIATPVVSPLLPAHRDGRYVSPVATKVYDETALLKFRGVVVPQTSLKTLRLPFLNDVGTAVDLTNYGLVVPVASGSSSSYSSTQLLATGSLDARLIEVLSCNSPVIPVIDVVDPANGIVDIQLTPEITAKTGIYVCDFAVKNEDGQVLFTNSCYIWVDQTNWGDQQGLPRFDSLKLDLRDSDPVENMLIDHVDFDVAEVCQAALRTVDRWNLTPPLLSNAKYTTATLPYREIWRYGIQLYLFQTAEEHYRRNKLQYSAGGTNTNDKNRDAEYNRAWHERLQMLQTMIKQQKTVLNMQRGWGSFRTC